MLSNQKRFFYPGISYYRSIFIFIYRYSGVQNEQCNINSTGSFDGSSIMLRLGKCTELKVVNFCRSVHIDKSDDLQDRVIPFAP